MSRNNENTMQSPNIVLLCLDTLRKDFYDEYAPRLRDMATVEFKEMRAMSSWSAPSHAAMIWGELPHETGVHTYHKSTQSMEQSETWIRDLADAGYSTLGVSANIYAGPVFGFDTFFDEFYPVSASRRFPEGMDVERHLQEQDENGNVRAYLNFLESAVSHDHTTKTLLNGILLKLNDVAAKSRFENPFDAGGRAVARTLTEQIQGQDGPVFAFANFMDVHSPREPFRGLNSDLYDCPTTFSSRRLNNEEIQLDDELAGYNTEIEWIRDLYAADTEYLDRIVSSAIREIQETTDRDTAFIITSDHGEHLGYESEGYRLSHTSSLSESLLHVPFDLVCPFYDDETVAELTSHQDIGDVVTSLSTRDELPDITRDHAFAEIAGAGASPLGDDEHWDRAQRAIYAPEKRKYVIDELGGEAVYDVGNGPNTEELEPDEQVPEGLFDEHFGPWPKSAPETSADIDDVTKERLADLGYR